MSCEKPVFLDFFKFIVQVEALTSVLDKFSGFGLIRNRTWFVEEYLSECRKPGPLPRPRASDGPSSYPWPHRHPYRLTEHSSRWMLGDGQIDTYQKRTPYVPLNYYWKSANDDRHPVWADVVTKLPQIANGWETSELQAMKQFLHGQPIIIGGRLRLMPPAADQIQVTTTVRETEALLTRVETHIQAGRIPVLKIETKQSLLARAEQSEIQNYGATLASLNQKRKPPTSPRTLFD